MARVLVAVLLAALHGAVSATELHDVNRNALIQEEGGQHNDDQFEPLLGPLGGAGRQTLAVPKRKM